MPYKMSLVFMILSSYIFLFYSLYDELIQLCWFCYILENYEILALSR